MKAQIVFSATFLMIFGFSTAAAQSDVTVTGITNVSHDSLLAAGLEHTLTIRYDASGAPPGRSYLTANAWKIFSPDGADWGYVQGTMLPGFSGLGWEYPFVNHFNKTAGTGFFGLPQPLGAGNISGADTVAVQLAGLNSQPGGVVSIEFTSRREDAGLHLCIDSCGRISGGWEWANPDGLIEPTWEGIKCWVIGCCAGKVGDVDGLGGDEPTIGDIIMLVDFLFVSGQGPDCLEEADVNLSGTLVNPPLDWRDVTIGDITMLVDHLFISYPVLADCP